MGIPWVYQPLGLDLESPDHWTYSQNKKKKIHQFRSNTYDTFLSKLWGLIFKTIKE